MSGNNVEININAKTKGQESVEALTGRLDDMAKVLDGELKNQAQAAAGELRKLGEQQAAISAFDALSAEARKSSMELAKAEKEAKDFAEQIGRAGPPTQQEAQALQVLQERAGAVSTRLGEQKQAAQEASAKLQGYGIAATQTATAQQRLTAQTDEVRQRVAGLVPAYKGAETAADSAGRTSQRSHRAMADGMESISTQLARVQSAYIALQGGGQLGSMIKSALDTADAYNNLAARIKISTGEGQAFEQAMAAVANISLRTHSSLETTGTLYARLNDAGKSAGLGAQQAQEQALALTETINQAVQLSGASAQASDAAITQLIQGLQSGVLRGDEFNSVMEQAPRLAKALGDGLGVTTGELRKMAEAGRLSADVVTAALKGQSDTLKAEFATLPPTVGRAVQDLSTAWTLYIGETDKATGASATAARAIEALAANLKTVAGYLVDTAQAAAGFTALRLAQHFLGLATAATSSATAVAANATAMQATGAAATATAATVGRFAAVLTTLRTFTLIGLVTNFKDIGTWIGEGIAKLQGYKDKSAELAAQEALHTRILQAQQAERAKDQAAIKASQDAQLGLSKVASEVIAKFDQLRKDGKAAGEAIADIGKDFDLAKLPGIRDATAVLNALVVQGKISATEFEAAWANALKGQDLALFETKARAALAGVTAEAQKLAQVNDAVLAESVRRVGPEYERLAGVVSKAATSAINDTAAIISGMDRLKSQGVDVAAALQASIGKGIDTANTQKALDAVKAQLEQVRKVLGDKVADDLFDQISSKAKKLNTDLQETEKAFARLGIQSKSSLKDLADQAAKDFSRVRSSGDTTANGLSAGWRKMAEAAIAANGGVASETIKAQAATYGLKVEVDATGKAIVTAMSSGSAATQGYTQVVNDARTAQERLNAARERSVAAREKEVSLKEREKALEDKRRNVDSEGFTKNTAGQRVVASAETETSIYNQLKGEGLDEATASRKAAELFKRYQLWAKGTSTQLLGGGASASAAPDWLLKPWQQIMQDEVRNTRANGSGQVAKTYDIRINGRTYKAGSDADAQALIATLKSARLSA